MRASRANAAFFNTAATQTSNMLPKARAESSNVRKAAAQGEFAVQWRARPRDRDRE